jgi:cytochrome c-type biogenesis protein CcmH
VITRRGWLQAAGLASVGVVLGRNSRAQQSPGVPDTSNLFAMDQSAARSVRLPAKPGAIDSMTRDERDALEHRLRCQCGCTLDVYTCRTTDFACQVSPSMHRDVVSLVQGGYGAQEILDAFVNTYGERVLMSPTRTGFNIVGWVLPGAALATGAVLLAVLLHRWKRPERETLPRESLGALNATPDELARLEAAIRDDS